MKLSLTQQETNLSVYCRNKKKKKKGKVIGKEINVLKSEDCR